MSEPLLRRLLNKEELAHQACVTFHTILIYMGDIPGRQTRVGLELTDLIFTGPLKQASSLFVVVSLLGLTLLPLRRYCGTRFTARS